MQIWLVVRVGQRTSEVQVVGAFELETKANEVWEAQFMNRMSDYWSIRVVPTYLVKEG